MAVLTYRAAKRGLLNTVHTEYQKTVMVRLRELSTELASEFDSQSEAHWARTPLVDDAVEDINSTFLKNRDRILSEKKFPTGIRVGADELRLMRMLGQIQTDPFVPKVLREEIVDLLGNRLEVLQRARVDVLREYAQDLANGKYLETLESNKYWLHNKVLDALYQQGCGVSQIDEAVGGIRLSMQRYFESFNPLG
jgi:hypothetical protein